MSTTYMNLTLPTVSSTIGPDWATQLNAALTTIDSHDHSSGKGTKVPVSGLNINDDLNFNNNSQTNVGATTYQSLSAVLSTLNTLYVKDGDLYFNDSAGSNVRLTASGSINLASLGAIGGDYGTGGSSIYYTDSTKTYTFEDSASDNAALEIGDLTCEDITSSGTITAGGALTVSGTATLDGTTTIAGTTTATGAVTFSGNTSGRGIIPVGGILPLMANLTGITDVTATTAADSNGFVVCGGQTISDASSPLNGQTIPNINNSVFLMGSSTAGSTGGANSLTLSEAQLPSHTHSIDHGHADTFSLSNATFASSTHTHDMSHTHMWSYVDTNGDMHSLSSSDDSITSLSNTDTEWCNVNQAPVDTAAQGMSAALASTSLYTTGVIDAPTGSGSSAVTGSSASTNTVTLSGAVTDHSGNSGSTGSGSSVDNRPSYITCKFIMRIE